MKKAGYERQENETVKAFEAFTIYRDLGITRSIREVAKKLNKSVALLGRWSSQYNWVERAQEYDDELDRKALLQQEKARRDMVKRHANHAMMFQQKVLERMQKMKPEELSPSELIRWFSESVKIERLSRGESTDIAEVSHSGEVTEKHEWDITQRIDRYEDVYSKVAERSKTESDNEGDGN
jgi:hypothetical protein